MIVGGQALAVNGHSADDVRARSGSKKRGTPVREQRDREIAIWEWLLTGIITALVVYLIVG